jgi:CHASE3 domain sensor protein
MTNQLEPTTTEATDPVRAIAVRLRTTAVEKIEEVLAELPATMRRLRTLLAVLSISIPLFLLALAAVLWHLAS